ncbi:DRTGG domain-containing protein [Natranaerovirga hydrolytica]|uniref:DRTGG domain-containing protein n=1 Tax=Natranaerovirga hydrolytica TaxID=680378 RepID=A0A4R1MY70_9FIRM|nr:DRTGG domain-containing protein [Natranaerovirga hydrolytica]TCK98075.1 DRTGG domain-containing protein [Natranaerovirga hydrolytica]
MIVKDIIEQLSFEICAGEEGINNTIEGGFVGDLLSVVMSNAKEGQVWVTIQSHVNIIAVASLINLSCIIITEGFQPDQDTLLKANEEKIPILITKESSYETIKKLIAIGV